MSQPFTLVRRRAATAALGVVLLVLLGSGACSDPPPADPAPPPQAPATPSLPSQDDDPAHGGGAVGEDDRGEDGSDPADDGRTVGDDAPDEAQAGDPPATSPEAPHPVHTAPPALPTEVRGAWVHLFDDQLKTRAGIAEVVAELVAADANVVFAQVARRQDAYYASQVLPPTSDPALAPGLDVLAELVAQAHPAGIAVHAWITLTPTWHDTYAELPPPPGWVTTAHGAAAPVADRWVTRRDDGSWTDHLDPALPAVRDHLAAVVTELVARTEADGVHLDYVRYPDQRAGYHPEVLARYRAETGATGTPTPDDPAWSAWRRAQVTALVEQLAAATAAAEQRHDREVALSAAVITWGPGPAQAGGFAATRTAREALQDWPAWVRDGTVDAVVPMNYFRAHEPEHAGWFDSWLAYEAELAAAHPAVRILPGIGGWLNEPPAVLAQVGAAVAATDAAVVYSFQQPTADETRQVWRQLADDGWRGTAP